MVSIVLFHSTATGIVGLFSKLIEWFTGSPISHCGIGLQVNGQPYILHATWPSVVLVPRSDLLKTHTIVAEFEILENADDEVKLAEKKIGESYGILTLFGYIPVILAKYLNIGVYNPFYSKCSTVCSEFVIELDVNHEIHEFDGLDPANVTPAMLFSICNSGTSFKRII